MKEVHGIDGMQSVFSKTEFTSFQVSHPFFFLYFPAFSL